jgi:hypothetical protein
MKPSKMTMVTNRPRIALNCSSFIASAANEPVPPAAHLVQIYCPEMCQRLVAQPSLDLRPCLNFALREEPIEVIAEPHVEAGVIEARHLEVDLAVVEPL